MIHTCEWHKNGQYKSAMQILSIDKVPNHLVHVHVHPKTDLLHQVLVPVVPLGQTSTDRFSRYMSLE